MKKYLLTLVVALFGAMAYAQAPIQPKEMQLNAGLGFSSNGIPVYAGLEFGAWENISLGGVFTYRGYSQSIYGDMKYKYNSIAIKAIGNYHFNDLLSIPSKFDVYAGVSIGYNILNSEIKGGNSKLPITASAADASAMFLGGQVGGRYFFSDNFGLNAEISAGSYFGLTAGITYKF